jgi:hypothetical protein
MKDFDDSYIPLRPKNGVYLKTVNFDEMFANLTQPPIIVNDFDITKEEDRERLNFLLYTKYEGDTLANLPSCDCRQLSGDRNIGRRHVYDPITGLPGCNTLVLPVTEKPLESMLWMETPPGVPAFVNPTVWRILSKELTKNGFNILEWLCNPYYHATVKVPPIMAKVQSLNLPMGLCNFHDHYDEIIDKLYYGKIFCVRVSTRNRLYEYLKSVRSCTFTKRLPFPSRLTFVTEENNNNTYADHKMLAAVDGILTIASMDVDGAERSIAVKEGRCVRAVVKLNEFYRDFEAETAATKEGIFRKLIYGTRPHWTYRAVISSLHRPHLYDTLALPWSVSILLFKAHLSNKLLKSELTPNDIISLLYENTLRPHVLLEGLFDELIAESPGGRGIPTTLGRNPTLKRGSIERFFINEIKRDTNINTISLSVLCLRAKNADYDGKALPSINTFNCWKLLIAA